MYYGEGPSHRQGHRALNVLTVEEIEVLEVISVWCVCL